MPVGLNLEFQVGVVLDGLRKVQEGTHGNLECMAEFTAWTPLGAESKHKDFHLFVSYSPLFSLVCIV